MDEVYRKIDELLSGSRAFALATVVHTSGSTPRKTGARMLIMDNGEIFGTVGGGCGEAEVWQQARQAMAQASPALITVDLTEDVEGEDKICGGTMRVFIEPFNG
jgi:xanthine dehydrogenase accessory factor